MITETKATKPAAVSNPDAKTENNETKKRIVAAPADSTQTRPAKTIAGAPPVPEAAPRLPANAKPEQLDAFPAPAVAWSDEDERGFQALLARRKAAGFQPRGRDVGQQLLRPGKITPNAGTVVATIVGLVAERGTVKRGALVDAMGETAFPHAKARPSDRNWCQGYVAGALRDGYLAIAGESSPAKETAEVAP